MTNEFNRADEISRRSVMAHAAKACMGVGFVGGMGYGGSGLFGADVKSVKANPPGGGKAKRVIYLYMGGGMSHLDTFDVKPGAATQGPVEAIKTSAKGLKVSQYYPKTAKQGHHLCLMNSLTSTAGAHEQGNYFMHTSYPMRGTIKHPHLGAWAARLKGRANPTLPANVKVGRGGNSLGGGFLETKYAALPIGDPAAGLQDSKRFYRVKEDRYNKRLARAKALNQKFLQRYNQKQVRAYGDLYADAVKLMKSEDLKVFDLSQESAATRAAYGADNFGQGCLLARRLVEKDVRFVEVYYGGWDTHSNNFEAMATKGAVLDAALGSLLKDLSERGLLDSTMVVLSTEFGRTPDIVKERKGRNHYPKAFTCLLAGGGVKGGQAWGKTDAEGKKVVKDPVNIPDFNATIAYAMGLPLSEIVHSPSGRPFTVAHKGRPVTQIF